MDDLKLMNIKLNKSNFKTNWRSKFINYFLGPTFKKIFNNGCVSIAQIIDDEKAKDMIWYGTMR